MKFGGRVAHHDDEALLPVILKITEQPSSTVQLICARLVPRLLGMRLEGGGSLDGGHWGGGQDWGRGGLAPVGAVIMCSDILSLL